MGLETGDYISNLDPQFPLEADPTHEGNEHLQLIKNVLKMTFPGSGGGWTGPLTAPLDFLNGLVTVGIPDLISRAGNIVSIAKTSDTGVDVYGNNKNSMVMNWEDEGIQSATVLNTANLEETINRPSIVDAIYPVGSIIDFTEEGPDPNTYFPGTTWVAMQGRFLIGSGTINDGINDPISVTVGDTGGEVYHKLTVDEMPIHSHNSNRTEAGGTISGSGFLYHTTGGGDTPGQPLENKGGDEPHINMPPFLVVNRWTRTA